MKKSLLKKMVVLALIVCLGAPSSWIAYGYFSGMRDWTKMETEDEIIAYFRNRTFAEIIEEMNLAEDDSALLYPANILMEKAEAVSDETLVAEILNVHNSDGVRYNLIQISRVLGREAIYGSLLPLLDDATVSDAIKQQILAMRPEEEPAANVSSDINGLIAEADKIISSTEYSKENPDGVTLVDRAVSELSQTRTIEAITYIVGSKNIDHFAKVGAISENVPTLISMITEKSSEKNIKLVLEAMRILPVTDLIPPLEKVLEGDISPDLASQIREVISYVEAEGVAGNSKEWQK